MEPVFVSLTLYVGPAGALVQLRYGDRLCAASRRRPLCTVNLKTNSQLLLPLNSLLLLHLLLLHLLAPLLLHHPAPLVWKWFANCPAGEVEGGASVHSITVLPEILSLNSLLLLVLAADLSGEGGGARRAALHIYIYNMYYIYIHSNQHSTDSSTHCSSSA